MLIIATINSKENLICSILYGIGVADRNFDIDIDGNGGANSKLVTAIFDREYVIQYSFVFFFANSVLINLYICSYITIKPHVTSRTSCWLNVGKYLYRQFMIYNYSLQCFLLIC